MTTAQLRAPAATTTAPGRDRGIDALRALAIAGVVLGHWLVTALVDGGVASPLRYLPELAPVSWPLQTLAVFFLVGGFAAARARGLGSAPAAAPPSRAGDRADTSAPAHPRLAPPACTRSHGSWVGARVARLGRPVTALLLVWAGVLTAMSVAGAEPSTVRAVAKLVLSPLWFLGVYVLLTAAAPLATRLHPGWPLAVVAAVDLLRLPFGAPAALGWVNVVAGWLVFYALGAAWARGALAGRTVLWTLLAGGTAATTALVAAGYPAAMVGVPGAGFSNLNPPSLAVVTFGLAQCGAAGLLLPRLRRSTTAATAVTVTNRYAMTIFLWHQTAMIAVTAVGLAVAGPLPGLHTRPDDFAWVVARFAWLPLFAAALTLCWLLFHTREDRRRPEHRSADVGG